MLFVFLLFIVCLTAKGKDYSLQQDLKWQDIVEQGGMYTSKGRMKRFIQLKSNYTKQENVPFQECTLPSGQKGHCRYIRYCMQEEFKTNIIALTNHVCVIKNQSMGVCCPDDRIVLGAERLAGELPAIASEDDDVLLKITRAENRGCGLSTRAINSNLGSRQTNLREWPWMASVTLQDHKQYCGGVLITERHVLTAAHCTEDYKAEQLAVRLGEYDFKRTNDSRSLDFDVVEKIEHTYYQSINHFNDIAILKINRPAVFNTYVWPICLPPPDLNLVNETAALVGWGTTKFGYPRSKVLLEVSIPIWDHNKCKELFVDSVFKENLCAGGYKGGQDACQVFPSSSVPLQGTGLSVVEEARAQQWDVIWADDYDGDSGGPLMYQMASGRWAVIGIVSWGLRCGEPNHPGLYTRVDKYIDWILENVR